MNNFNLNKIEIETFSIHDRIAEWVSNTVGSMWFIYLLFIGGLLWMAVNLLLKYLGIPPFDEPWSFAVLLFISSQMQTITPLFILVSQNRQMKRDIYRAEQEYKISIETAKITDDTFNYLVDFSKKLDTTIETLKMQTESLRALSKDLNEESNLLQTPNKILMGLMEEIKKRPCLTELDGSEDVIRVIKKAFDKKTEGDKDVSARTD